MATIDVINPATAETIDSVPNMSAEEVDEVVERGEARAARVARRDAGRAGGAAPRSSRDVIDDNAEELAQIESRNVGKPLARPRDEMPFCADNLRFFAGAARNPRGQVCRRVHQGLHLDGPPRADRDRRRDLPVELPADDGDLEARAGARRPATSRS